MELGIRGFIFDFDGVIVDSEKVKFVRLEMLLKKRGLRLEKKDFKTMIGMKTEAFLHKRFKGRLTKEQIKSISKARREDQIKHLGSYAKPIPGVKKLIYRLKKKNFKMCLATGTKRVIVNKSLQILDLRNCFEVMVTGEEFKSSKPNPEVYALAMKKLKLPKKSLIVVEDSAAGVAAAKKAGLRCIAITTTQSRKELRKADIVLSSFTKLEKMLEA